MKTNGATWKAYLESWPDGKWFDDSDETFDGAKPADDLPDDGAVVQFTCGVVYVSKDDHEGRSLVSDFKAWQRSQTHSFVVCLIPKDRCEEFSVFLTNIGGRAADGEVTR